jgi:hypothetical protein
MLPSTPRPPRSGDDRTRTGGLSPDKRALCSSELRPRSSAGGIRTHGLELMRLARTAAPLPRKVWLAGVEPALSGSRSRRGGQSPLQPAGEVPPAGLEPAASGLRARRHRRFDHGGLKLRRQGSNLPFAINSRASYRLDYAGTSGGSRTRTCETGTALRLSTALPFQLGHASTERKERESNPQGLTAHPFSRRGTAPMAVLPVAPAGVEPAPTPIKSRGLCQLELRSQGVAGRDRTCGRPAFQAGALPAELRPHDGRGWSRTSGLLCVRQALWPSELLARRRLDVMREAGVEPAASSISEKRSSS